jgi:Ca-activated chloride channel family protein
MFSFGVGADLNAALIERLAIEGKGTAQFVRPEESVERAVAIVAARLSNPVVTNVRVYADGVRLLKRQPSESADIFAGQDFVLLARYDGSGMTRLRFEGETSEGPVSWTSRVDFPGSTRENSFIARLWATQRIGYLSAEKRRNGGSSEIDNEIRDLGEKYAIPTEFTSYLVVEPQMRRDALQGRVSGVAAGVAAPPSANARAFEKTREAAKQRAVTSLAAADEADYASAGRTTRRAGTRTFVMKRDTWTDSRSIDSTKVVRVKAFSDAYFRIMEAIPELREVFALGDKVIVGGREIAIEVGTSGLESMSDSDIKRIQSKW